MSRLKRNIGHIGGIILWSTLFYMFWDEFVCICNQGNIWIPSLTRLLKLIFLNVPLFGHQLWYLFSYFYVLLIIWAVVKYNWWKWLFYAVPILLMSHIVLLLSGREVSIYLVRNFLFLGLPFFAIGAMLKSMGIGGGRYKLKKYNKVLLAGFVVLSLVALLERICLLSVGKCAVRELYLSSIVAAICLFFVALSFKSNQKCRLSVWGEKYSLYIYIFHPVFVYCCKTLLKGTILFTGYTYVAPVVVLLLTMLFVRLLLLALV